MKVFTLTFLLLITNYIYAQSLEQHVIGSAGNYSTTSSGTSLSSTIGEMIISTESSSSAILTQGFQQPVIVVTSTTDIAGEGLEIQVFPNPTAQKITVKKEHPQLLYAELIDIQGRLLSSYDLEQSSTEIDLKDLPSSTYFLSVKTTNNTSIQTFKLQKIQ